MTQSPRSGESRIIELSILPHALGFLWKKRSILDLSPGGIREEKRTGPLLAVRSIGWDSESRLSIDSPGGPAASAKEQSYGILVQTGDTEEWFAVGYSRLELQGVLAQIKKVRSEWLDAAEAPRRLDPLPDSVEEFLTPESEQPTGDDIRVDAAPRSPQPVKRRRRNSKERPSGPNEIQIHQTPDGVSIVIPMAGLFRGNCLVLMVPGCIVSFLLFGALIAAMQNLDSDSAGIGLMFIGFTVALGILALFNLILGSARITVDRSSLLVVRKSMLRKRRNKFPRGDVTQVKRGDSQVAINEMPLQELQIYIRSKIRLRMMGQRKSEDIDRVAEALRTALGLQADSDHE